MDRVAQLAACASNYLDCERNYSGAEKGLARKVTRSQLYWDAVDLGFPENEISAAIDAALGGR